MHGQLIDKLKQRVANQLLCMQSNEDGNSASLPNMD